MSELRLILAGIGIVIVAGVYWISRRSTDRRQKYAGDKQTETAPDDVSEEDLPHIRAEPVGEAVGDAAREPVAESRPDNNVQPSREISRKIVSLFIVPKTEDSFAGNEVLHALRTLGLQFGRYGVFHRQIAAGEPLFSIANMLEPGNFDPQRMEREQIKGLAMFLTLPGPPDELAAFDDMLRTCRQLAEILHGEPHDETHSILTRQTAQILREQVIAFGVKLRKERDSQ